MASTQIIFMTLTKLFTCVFMLNSYMCLQHLTRVLKTAACTKGTADTHMHTGERR